MTTEATETTQLGLLARRSTFLVLLVLLAGLGAAAELTCLVRADTGYLLYAAERLLDGAKLYVDVVEINPPLIIWLHTVPVVVSRLTGLSAILLYRLMVIALLLGAVGLSAGILRWLLRPDPHRYRLMVLLITFVLFPRAGIDFGEREHLLLALTLPYLLLAMGRTVGLAIPPAMAVGSGSLAGLGLVLKPHFLLVWLALEGYLRIGRPRYGWKVLPESCAIVAVLVAYAATIGVVLPQYFALVALLGPAYAGFLRDPFVHVLVTAPGTPVVLLAVLAFVALRPGTGPQGTSCALTVATGACFLAGAAQQKGWTYHFYPATASALLLLGWLATDPARQRRRFSARLYGAIASAAVGTSLVWAVGTDLVRIAGLDRAQEQDENSLIELARAVRRDARGGSMYVMSYTIRSSFPLVNYSGVQLASRFPHLWILESAYQDQLSRPAPLRYRNTSEMDPAERYMNQAVYEDLARRQPAIILVLRHARDVQGNGLRRLDYIGYFARDPRLADLFRTYRFVENAGEYRIYRRAAGVLAGAAPLSSVPGTHDIVRHESRGTSAILLGLVSAAIFLLFLSVALRRKARGDGPEISSAI